MRGVLVAEPIMEFKSELEAYECLREWQDRLFLNNWIIKLVFCDSIHNENGEELAGQNTFQITNQCCTIQIVKLNDDVKSRIAKVSQEAVLVHELLHCKYNWIQLPNSFEGNYYDELEHALLEEMAKSLIMAKYNIPFSWFKNFSESEDKCNA